MSGLMDLGITQPEKTIRKKLGDTFRKFFLDSKCKHIGVFGESGMGKTVDLKTLAEFHLENDPDCLIISIDEKNEFYPFMSNEREGLQRYLKEWSREPKGYKTYMLIPYVGSNELPRYIPKTGWCDEGEGVFIDYKVVDEKSLDYIDRLAMISGRKGRPQRAVSEWLYEAELLLIDRKIEKTRENLLSVLMNAKNLSKDMKRAIKHAIIDMGTDGIIGNKNTVNMEGIINFCVKNGIQWINVCQYYFPARLSMPRIVFIKHIIQQLYQLKRHAVFTNKFIILIPECHTYIATVGYKDKYIARDVFTDVLTKGRSLGVKIIADSQAASIIPESLRLHFDTESLHRLGNYTEFIRFCMQSLGLRSSEEIQHSDKLLCKNMLTGEVDFPNSRYGIQHFIYLYRIMDTGDFVLKDYDGNLWYLDGFKFPICAQYHEDKQRMPLKDDKVPKAEIVKLFKEKTIDLNKYQLLEYEDEGEE